MIDYTSTINPNIIIYQCRIGHKPPIYKILSIPTALSYGEKFKVSFKKYTISEEYKFVLQMHKHAPHLKIKLDYASNRTIAEIYEFDPTTLYHLLIQRGGSLYLAKVLLGYETLYNQENELLCQKNQM